MRIGYACLNNTLASQQIQVNRSMVKRTFLSKGIGYASELALRNVIDLAKLIEWNIVNGIHFYRMSSEMFPWMSEYELSDLPDWDNIRIMLSDLGRKVKQHGLRLTFHPGPFNVLASNNTDVVRRTVKELAQHAEIMDALGLPATPFAKINIHVGGAYGDKHLAIKRFCDHLLLLPGNARNRLTIENDDKENMFAVSDLVFIHERTGIPVVFDYFHHRFCTGGLSEEEAFKKALLTWPDGITPVVHYSSSRKTFEDQKAAETSHADFVYEVIDTYGRDVDIMLEAKAKELALSKFIMDYGQSARLNVSS